MPSEGAVSVAPSSLARGVDARLPRDTLVRQRVSHLLAAAVRCPLAVVCAPAGYGKTTALATWLQTDGRRFAWVALDSRLEDPRRLWTQVLAALERAGWRLPRAAAALRDGAGLVETVLPRTLDELAGAPADEQVLVLDDYHHVTAAACHRLLERLLDAAPAGLRVVVASRTPPPLRLPRRRAAGTLAEVGARELAFARDEAVGLRATSYGRGLAADQLLVAHEHVEGWPAGLSLVVRALGRRSGQESFADALRRADADVAAYLAEEVLDGLDAPLRRFLARTSILDRLEPGLCAAVLDDPDAPALLERALRSHAFASAVDDGAPGAVRLHGRWRALLRAQLQGREPQLVPILHRRAASWLRRHGSPRAAVAHASQAGDGVEAARIAYAAHAELLAAGRYAALRRLLDAIPSPRGAHGPFCDALATLAWQLDGGDPGLVHDRWQALRRDHASLDAARLRALALIWPFFGRVGAAVADGRRVYAQHRGDRPAVRAAIAARLGLTLWFAGERAEAQLLVERHLDTLEPSDERGWALAALAFCAGEAGDADAGERHAAAAVALAERTGGRSALRCSIAYQALADARRRRGRLREAGDALDHAAGVTRARPRSLHHALTLVLEAELAVARHDRAQARTAVAAARAIADRTPDPGVLTPRLAAVEAMLARADDAPPGSAPSVAEQRVLALLASGLTLEAIATERLQLSINTVKSHRRRLYRRLGVRTRAEAVRVARDRGLI